MTAAADLVAMSEDAFQAHATREAARAIGDRLMATNLGRPLRSLTLAELDALATAAISRWVQLRAQRAAAGPPDPELIAI